MREYDTNILPLKASQNTERSKSYDGLRFANALDEKKLFEVVIFHA